MDDSQSTARERHNMGVVRQQCGDLLGAKLEFQGALRLEPDLAEAWNDLGIVHQCLGEMDEAGACFERMTALVPGMAGGYFNLGNVRQAQGKLLEAVGCYIQALEREPRFVEALNNLGTALQRLGQLEKARHSYQAALALCPEFSDARNNLGSLLSLVGRHPEAEASYREALALDPRSVAALNNLAGNLQAQMRLDEAEGLLRQALALEPQSAEASGNLANVLAIQGRIVEAGASYRSALRLQPNTRLRIHAAIMLPPLYESVDQLRRCRAALAANMERLIEDGVTLDPARELLPVNFLLAYQGLNDRELALCAAKLYQPAREPTALSSPIAPPAPHFRSGPGMHEPAYDGRIRIGFLSKFLCDHTIGDLTRGLIQQLSRSDFSVTVFQVGETVDETVSFLRECADAFVTLPDDAALAPMLVAGARLDLLVYPDIGMDPLSYTLAFSRLAPVQCVMWGHPVTTGVSTIDHFISSELLEPAGAGDHYTEHLVLLKSLPVYYYRPRLTTVAIEAPAGGADCKPESSRQIRREFELPQDAHLYLCPQSLFKFHPDFDGLLAAILQRDPAAKLVLIEAPHRHWTELLLRRFERTLNGTADRVIFVPRLNRTAFLRLLAGADVMLDPLHFGGGNTSFQALGLGLPVVTFPAPYMRGRVTTGCYRKMGFETCVAASAEEYVNLSVRLGTDPQFNALVRSKINERSSALFEDLGAVHELEAFFRSEYTKTKTRLTKEHQNNERRNTAPF